MVSCDSLVVVLRLSCCVLWWSRGVCGFQTDRYFLVFAPVTRIGDSVMSVFSAQVNHF